MNSYSKFTLLSVFAIIIYLLIASSSKFSFDSGQSLGRNVSNFSEGLERWILENEKVRDRFLAKRKEFAKGRKMPGGIGLWDGGIPIWSYFPPSFTCPGVMERIGTPGDGGKWTCGLGTLERSRIECIVYSFGVSTESTFEMEILERTSCKIFAFDPTVSGMNLHGRKKTPELTSRIQFSKLGLGAEDNSTGGIFTLGHFMRLNGHEWIDMLKIDIEGAEFPALKQIAGEFKDRMPFGHLNLEVHLLNGYPKPSDDLKAEFTRFYDLFGGLEEGGLRPFTWEVNHYPGIIGWKPLLMEYSFVNIKDRRNTLLQS